MHPITHERADLASDDGIWIFIAAPVTLVAAVLALVLF